MIFRKIFFPIFICLFVLNSCTDSKSTIPDNNVYFELIDKADAFTVAQKEDSAFYYYLKAKEICAPSEKERIAYVLFNIANLQQKKGDYSESEVTATEILKMYPENEHIYSVYNLLGLSYLEQYNFDPSRKYFNLALKSTTSEQNKIIYRNNIAYTYLKEKQFAKAQQLLYKLTLSDSLSVNAVSQAKVLDNLGYAYFKENNPKAITYLNQSLKIRESNEDYFERIASYMHLAEYYLNSDADRSRDFAQKAYNSATAINSPDDRVEAIKFLIATSKPDGIKNLALKQMSLSDSIAKVRLASRTQFAKIKYDFTLAQKESEKDKAEKNFYIALFIIACIISALVIFYIRHKNRKKLKHITYETETRISKRLHDELANDVFNALTYAETQDLQDNNKKEILLDNLDAIYSRTRNIARENSDIDTGTNFQDNLLSMIASYNSTEISVMTQNSNAINWLKVKKETKITIHRILQELLVNMKKHSSCNVVIIGFQQHKNTICITYKDNGIGTSEMLKFKNGLKNAENRIQLINGTLTFETGTDKGFKAEITAPL